MSNLTELEKIAASLDEEFSGMVKQANPNAVSEGYQPAVGLEPTQTNQDMANEMQGGQEPVQPLTDEELQLQQQLGLEQQQEIEQAEQAKEQERAQVDRALLEGAAGEAIQQMEDDELRDILIEKAASEMYGLSAFAHLIDLSTSNDVDGQIVKEAGEVLDYMSTSTEAFNDGINKVANLLFNDKPEQTIATFSNDGVHYVFEQLAKLEDFNTLEKVAHETSATALYKIAMNEGEGISASVDVLAEAYHQGIEDATLAVAKDKVVEELVNQNAIEEAAATEDAEHLASSVMEAFEKTAAPFAGARKAISRHRNTLAKRKELRGKRSEEVNNAVKDIDGKYQAGIDSANRRISHFRRKAGGVAAKGAVGVGTVGAVGAGAKKISNGRKNRADNQSEQQMPEQSYEQPYNNETEQLASSIMYAFEKTASPFNKAKSVYNQGRKVAQGSVEKGRKLAQDTVQKGRNKVEGVKNSITSGRQNVKDYKSNVERIKDLNTQKQNVTAGIKGSNGIEASQQRQNLQRIDAELNHYNKQVNNFNAKHGIKTGEKKSGTGKKVAIGGTAAVGLGGVGLAAKKRSGNKQQEEEEKVAFAINKAFEKTANFNDFFNTATLSYNEKTASVATKITNGIMKNVDRVKNLKSNTALMKDLTAQKEAIKAGQNVAKGVDVNETFANLQNAQRVVGALDSAKRDVAVGRAIAYGVPASVGTAGVIATAKALSNNKAQVMPEETDEFSKQASFNAPLTHLQNIKRLGQQVVSKGNLLARRNGDEGLALAASQFQFDNPYMSDLQNGNTLKGNVEGFRNGSFVEKKMIEYGAGALPNVMERLAFDMVQPPSPPAGMPTSAPTITHKPLTPSQPHNLKPVNDKTPMSPPGTGMKTITPQNNIQGY